MILTRVLGFRPTDEWLMQFDKSLMRFDEFFVKSVIFNGFSIFFRLNNFSFIQKDDFG